MLADWNDIDLADPVGDRIVETLGMAPEVRGSDLGQAVAAGSKHDRQVQRNLARIADRQRLAPPAQVVDAPRAC